MGDVTIESKDFDKLNNEYHCEYVITYLDFCKANIINEPATEIVEGWVSSVLERLRETEPVDNLMNLFEIDPADKNIIANRHYQITVDHVENNTDEKVLLIQLTLLTTPTSTLE